MSDDHARVLCDIDDAGIAHVRLNRPDKRNGLDLPMFRAIAGTARDLAHRKDLRAVVLSGEGPAFCAGLDVKAQLANPQAMIGELMERPSDRIANLAQEVAWGWRELPVPVIAALQGPVFGGGLQIALGADLRYAAPDAQLSVMEIAWGLIPDMSASQTLLGLVRPDVAKELTFTGRVVDAEEAAALGLVTRVVDDALAAARDTARVIAGHSPSAVRHGKQLFDAAPGLSAEASFALEAKLQKELLGSQNQMEAMMARLQKRPPRFADPE
ncbi:MAG: crotonase/enoyl-CoA hydratase family protein [Myxococcota bacterium]